MRCGRRLVIHLSTMVPTFGDYDIKDVCPLKDHFFNRKNTGEKCREWIKPDEDFDVHKNKGFFECHKKFNIIILSNMSDPDCDDEIIQMVRD